MPERIRSWRLIALAALLLPLATDAFAQTDSPLSPGKPAGVHEAQNNHTFENTLLIGMSVVGVGIGVIWALNRLHPPPSRLRHRHRPRNLRQIFIMEAQQWRSA